MCIRDSVIGVDTKLQTQIDHLRNDLTKFETLALTHQLDGHNLAIIGLAKEDLRRETLLTDRTLLERILGVEGITETQDIRLRGVEIKP